MTRLAIPSKEIQFVVVGPTGAFKASRVQRANTNSDIPSTIHDELGSSSHAGEARDVPAVTLTFSAFDTGIKIFSALTGKDSTAYPAAGVDISSLGEMDAIFYIKSTTVNDYVKSAHSRRLQIRDFSYSYSVDGESTEDYTAIGAKTRWFLYDVVVDKFTTGTDTFTLTQTPIQLKNGDNALSVILDGVYLDEVATVPTTGQYRLVGTTLTTGDNRTNQCVVVYHANPAGNNWSDVSDTSMPAAVRGKDVKIKISANAIPRVQSVTINGSMNVQPVNEMGNVDKVVGYQRQLPTIDGTITVLDTDLELINLLQYGTTTLSGVEWSLGEGCVASGVSLSIQILDPCDFTKVLKEIYLDSISPTGDAYTANVNNNTTWTVNFRSTTAHCVIYSGAKA